MSVIIESISALYSCLCTANLFEMWSKTPSPIDILRSILLNSFKISFTRLLTFCSMRSCIISFKLVSLLGIFNYWFYYFLSF